MNKKIISTVLILSGLVFPAFALKCLADATAQFEQAKTYEQAGNYAQAEAIYKSIPVNSAYSYDALKAQEKLCCLYISWGKEAEAQTSYQALLSGFGGSGGILKAVDHVADRYRQMENYEKAHELYQYIVSTWPAEHAIDSQKGVVLSRIHLGDEAGARAAVEKLIAKFSGSQDIDDVLSEIAGEYGKVGKVAKGVELYRQVIEPWCRAEYTPSSQATAVEFLICIGDDMGAQTATDKLIADFSSHNDIAKWLGHIGNIYHRLDKFEKSREICTLVVQRWPQNEEAMESQKFVALSCIALGDDAGARAAVDKLVAQFSGNLNLRNAMYEIGVQLQLRGYRLDKDTFTEASRECFRTAVGLFEKVVSDFPTASFLITRHQNTTSAEACCYAGDAYSRLEDPIRSLACFQKVLDNYPAYVFAWHAQFMVGRNYEKMEELGLMSKTEADPKIKAAYEQLLEKYPTCQAARYSQEWLDQYNSSK
jgi:tetratricopeptide (TPR) repeat protein